MYPGGQYFNNVRQIGWYMKVRERKLGAPSTSCALLLPWRAVHGCSPGTSTPP